MPNNSITFQEENSSELPATPTIKMIEKAYNSIGFFRKFRPALKMLLEFSCLKYKKSDPKKHKRFSDSIDQLEKMGCIANSGSCAIEQIKNILNEKDPKNSNFNDISEYNKFCELVKMCSEELKSFDELNKISFYWLDYVEKELNKFVKKSDSLHKSFRRKIEKKVEADEGARRRFGSVRPSSLYESFKRKIERILGSSSGVVSDENIKRIFENVKLSSLFGLCNTKYMNYISNLLRFRIIFCQISYFAPPLNYLEYEAFFKNHKPLICPFDKIHTQDFHMITRVLDRYGIATSINDLRDMPIPIENYYLVYDFYSLNLIEFEKLMHLFIEKTFETLENHSLIIKEFLYSLEPFLKKENE